MSRQDIHKDPPEILYVVDTNKGYRIYWSIKHATNYAKRQVGEGFLTKIFEYRSGKKVAEFEPLEDKKD